MPPKKLTPRTDVDRRVLQLISQVVAQGKLTEAEVFEKIGIAKGNLPGYKYGRVSFTIAQVIAICKLTGASADWVFNLSAIQSRNLASKGPIERIEEALAELKGHR